MIMLKTNVPAMIILKGTLVKHNNVYGVTLNSFTT